MLNIQRRDDIDFCGQQFLHIFVPLSVLAPRDVGMCKLVDEDHIRPPSQNRVNLHFLENRAFVLDFSSWNDFQLAKQLFDRFAAMRFDDPDHHVFAAAMPAKRLAEHAIGLADTRCVAEEQFESPSGLLRRRSDLQPIFGLFRQWAVYSTETVACARMMRCKECLLAEPSALFVQSPSSPASPFFIAMFWRPIRQPLHSHFSSRF